MLKIKNLADDKIKRFLILFLKVRMEERKLRVQTSKTKRNLTRLQLTYLKLISQLSQEQLKVAIGPEIGIPKSYKYK